MSAPLRRPSFWSPVPHAAEAEALLAAYERVLEARNGALTEGGFERREAVMAELAAADVQYRGALDVDAFHRHYHRLDPGDAPRDLLAFLAFCKVNAAEAYGVELTARTRDRLWADGSARYRMEGILAMEERYHTRLLVGVSQHVEGLVVDRAWTPPVTLRALIACLATAPPSVFHPVLLGSEIAGVFTFNWMLNQVAALFPDDPGVAESMERRLIEVLVDEVGHVAFNRIVVGPAGLAAARRISGIVLGGVGSQVRELGALGLDAAARRDLAAFDLHQLPEEVRRRAFYV